MTAFVKLGYFSIRQRGSHVRLRHPTDSARRPSSFLGKPQKLSKNMESIQHLTLIASNTTKGTRE
ncbi:MAG: type II toxin-antitoxin system HicA family toxin [Candidatus Thorarchaeota archaeon]